MIKRIEHADYQYVLDLNETNVEVLSPMDREKLEFFVRVAESFDVVHVEGKPVGFIIVLREGITEYKSENYIWFSNNYPKFLYIDRIVIDECARGMGMGRDLYEHVFDHAQETGIDVVTAEIDTIPYNESSLKFHQEMGFREVGTQVIRGGAIQVSMQVREV